MQIAQATEELAAFAKEGGGSPGPDEAQKRKLLKQELKARLELLEAEKEKYDDAGMGSFDF